MAVVWPVNTITNADRTDGRAYFGTPTQSASGHPYFDNVANLASNQGVILSQGTHPVDGGFWTFGISSDINGARINGKASSLVQLSSGICLSAVSLVTNTDVQAHLSGPHSSTPSTLDLGIDKQAAIPHPEHLFAAIRDEDIPVTPSPDSMSPESFSEFSLVCCLSICPGTLI